MKNNTDNITYMNEEQRFTYVLNRLKTSTGSLITLGMLLERSMHDFADHEVLICKDMSITYRELYAHACHISRLLRAQGIKKRDRILLLVPNSIEFYIFYFGVAQLGAVVAPLNVFLSTKELEHVITDAQPALIIVSESLINNLPQTIPLPPVITESVIDLTTLPDTGPFEVDTLEVDEMAALLYTSGTTGFPKGVMLSSRNIMTNIAQGIARISFNIFGQERVFGALPLFHSFAQFACVWAVIAGGGCVIVVPKIERRAILEALKKRPTIFLGIPALYGLLALFKTLSFPDVKYFISGGDSLPNKIRAYFALLYQRNICSGYGLTETSPVIAADLDDTVSATNTVGSVVQGMKISIRDAQGKEVPHGAIGELWVQGDNVMLGYYNAQEATNEVLVDGWFHTGDMVYLDAHRKLVISGRSKDVIKHKSFNIYPQEIENVLLGYTSTIRAAVIGVPDELYGQIPIAYVQVKQLEQNLENILRDLCAQALAPYKIPRAFMCTAEELPLTATGKINKGRLQEMYKESTAKKP